MHSKLRMPSAPMTARMIAAIRNPHTDVLGHCTGRLITGRGRPQSEFDAEAVFTACRDHGVAVEVNCRPERQDPPDDLLRLAVEIGCVFAIDTDATHQASSTADALRPRPRGDRVRVIARDGSRGYR